jgi:hypothetical protein
MNELEMEQARLDAMAKAVQGEANSEIAIPPIAPMVPTVDPLVQATNTNFSPRTQLAANNIFGTTSDRGLV